MTRRPLADSRTVRLRLADDRYVAFGSISAELHRNTIQRLPNLRLPLRPRPEHSKPKTATGGAGRRDGTNAAEEESERQLPERWAKLRKMVVPLGKF